MDKAKKRKPNVSSPQQPTRYAQHAKQRAMAGKVWATNEFFSVVAILVLAFIAFFPSLKDGFVNWDDFGYIRDNAIIKDISLSNISHIFNIHTYVKGNYHPLTVLSYCLEYHFVKLSPFLYHFDNVVLHLLNVVAVYVLIRLITAPSKESTIKNKPSAWFQPVPAITALLFAIHPLRVESVTWVSERKDVLYTFFFLSSLIGYLLYIRKGHAKFYLFAIGLFILSILSKGQAVVLAPVLLLIDFFLKRKFNKKLWLEKMPFFALAIVWGIIAISAQHSQLTEQRLQFYTIPQRLLVACYGIVMYLYKLIAPLNLTCFYPYPAKLDGLFFVAPVIVFCLGFGVWRLLKRRMENNLSNAITLGALFFVVTISIVLQLLPVGDAVIAERYTYLPFLGLFFIVANVYTNLVKQKQLSTLVTVGGLAYVIFFFYLTFNQTKVWKNSDTLWSSVLENHPETAVAYADRGLEYYENKEYDKALSDFNNAIKYKEDYYDVYNSRGLVYKMQDKTDPAIADFKTSFALNPEYFIAAFNCGLTYVDANIPDSAIHYFNIALAADPQNAEYYYNLGIAYGLKKDNESAIENYNKALALNPNHQGAHNNRGFVYSGLHKYDLAISDFTRSIELNGNNPLAFANRSAAYYESKNYKAALADAQVAKSLGNDMGAHYFEILQSETAK